MFIVYIMRSKISNEEKLINHLLPKSSLLCEIEDELKADGLLGINIGSLEGRFLQSLVSQGHVEKVVEIGTQYAYSTTFMAEALGSKGHIFAFEKNPDHFEKAKKFISSPAWNMTGCKVSLILGDAVDTLPTIEDQGPFDLVFIDANKSKYLDYYRWAKQFLRSGGYLVADNVFLFGTVFLDSPPPETPKKMWQVMRQLLKEVSADPDFSTSLIPTKEGILFAVKK